MTAKLFAEIIKDAPTPGSVHIESSNTGAGPRKRRQPRDSEPSDWLTALKIEKADPDRQLMFGWASVVEKDGVAVVDKQGDIIEVEELEKAAYDFALYSRSQGDMHDRIGVGRLVESIVFTKEKQQALGIDLGMVGWWLGFKVDDPDTWSAIKRGDRPEFSIGGTAKRVDAG